MADAMEELGWALDRTDFADLESPGRPHLAAAAFGHPANAERVAEEGLTDSSALLVAYLIPSRPAYRTRTIPTVADAIAAIHDAGGVAVWAHPFWDVDAEQEVQDALRRFAAGGMDGVEAFYIEHGERQTRCSRPRRRARAAHDRLRGLPRARAPALLALPRVRPLRARAAPRPDRRRLRLVPRGDPLGTHGRLQRGSLVGDDAHVDTRPGAVASRRGALRARRRCRADADRVDGRRRAQRRRAAHRVPRVGAGRLPPGDRARDASRARHAPAGARPRRPGDRGAVAHRRRRRRLRRVHRGRLRRRALRVGRLRLGRRRPAAAPQGAPPARRALRVRGRRRVRGVRHAGRPRRDAALLRQALPRGVARAGARRRRGHRVHVGLVGGPPPAAPTCATTARRATSTRSTACGPSRTRSSGSRSNLTGRWGARRFVGRSKVVDRRRRRARGTGHDEGLALARIDPAAAIAETLLDIDHLGDRRPAAYGEPRPAFARAGSPSASSGSSSVGLSIEGRARVVDERRRRAQAVRVAPRRRPRASASAGRSLWTSVRRRRPTTQATSRSHRPTSCRPRSSAARPRPAVRALRSASSLSARLRSLFGHQLELRGDGAPRPAACAALASRSAPASSSLHGRAGRSPRDAARANASAAARSAGPSPSASASARSPSPSASRAQRRACSGATPWRPRRSASALGPRRVEAHELAARADRRQHARRDGRSAGSGARTAPAPRAS